MQADNLLISRLEKLARLQLDASEKSVLEHDLSQILKMVDKLLELDVSEIEPLAYPTNARTQLRNDESHHEYAQAEALKNAPTHDGQFFQVPKIIE